MHHYLNAFSLSAYRQARSQPQLFALLALFFCVGLISGCSKTESPAALPPAVKVFEVGSSSISRSSQSTQDGFSAEAAPGANQIPGELRSELSGTVIEVLVKAGQSVSAGQSLVRLDPRDAKLANSAAEVQVQAARARLANVEADFNRYTELLNKGFISKAEWDRREALLIAERAQFEATLDQLGVYTLRALDPGVVRQVLASRSQVVQASDLLVQLQVKASSRKSLSKEDPKFSRNEVYSIPLTALLDGRTVMRVIPNQDQFLVEPIAVNVLEANERHARVEGLVEGDTIVAVGAHLLSPGQTVRRLTP
ncbi:MAG: efflux RND transporter periplasmic adaptor subunit [Burkholderiaceae bacterium]